MTSTYIPRSPSSIGWSARFLAFLEKSHTRALMVLFAISLIAFFPGFATLQPLDRDEPRFAQASKQMLETGDFIDIRFQEESRYKKPAGIYWLQAATVSVAEAIGIQDARSTIAFYRIPSLISAILIVLGTYWAALCLLASLKDIPIRRIAFTAATFMASAILLGVEARLAKTDAVLTLCTLIVMSFLGRIYLNRCPPLSFSLNTLFWVAVGASILVKGPILLMIAGLASLALSFRERSARWLLALRPVWGSIIVLAMTLPWFFAIWLKTGNDFFIDSIGKDMLAKAQSGQERHWAPPGTYLLAFFGTFWPVAAFTAISAYTIWKERHASWVAFCFAWIIPTWLVFEAMPTKLPHYVLPVYPAIAILTAWALMNGKMLWHSSFARITIGLVPLIPIGVSLGLSYFAYYYDRTILYPAIPGFLISISLSLWSWRNFIKKRAESSALLAVCASLSLSVSVFGIAHPLIPSLKISPRLAAAARSLDCENAQWATTRYREPSLIFLVHTDLVLTDGIGAADFLASGQCRMAFVDKRDQEAFDKRLSQNNLTPALITRVKGLNINGGHQLDIGVYRVSPQDGISFTPSETMGTL